MRKFFSLRKQKNRCSEGRKIALRKPIFFSAQGGKFSYVRKFSCVRTQIYCPAHGDEFLFVRRKIWVGKKGIFPSNGKEFSFEGEGTSLRRKGDFPSNKKKFPSEGAGPCLRKETFFLRGEGLPFVEGKGAEGAGLADDELADEGRRREDRPKEVDARGDVDPCFLDAPCREELSPLHVEQIQLSSGLGEA